MKAPQTIDITQADENGFAESRPSLAVGEHPGAKSSQIPEGVQTERSELISTQLAALFNTRRRMVPWMVYFLSIWPDHALRLELRKRCYDFVSRLQN